MKKLVYLFFGILIVFTLSACNERPVDTTAPVITQVTGLDTTFDEDTTEPVWGTYFTIEDDFDGVIQLTNSMIVEDVDMTTPGTYTVTLTVTDEAGNENTKAITITIDEVVILPQGDLIATYEGMAPVGMGGMGTYVIIYFYDDNTFDLSTSSPRGGGTYVIADGTISLTYDDEHPEDGGDWVLSGAINTTDMTDVTTVFTLDAVEYEINMGTPTAMDVGTTTFGIVIGCKAVISKVADMQTSFFVDDVEPDWTTYFTIEDETDGTIAVTTAMITETVDMTVDAMYTVSLTVTNSVGNSTTTTIMVFVNEPEVIATYEGVAPVGMGGMGTYVMIYFYDDETFTLSTSAPRGGGTYAIADGTISLTYDNEHPDDGGTWVLSGAINTTSVTDITTVFTLDPVEYEINMGTLTAMDIGTTTFNIIIGSKAVISKVADMQTSFFIDDVEPDWTTYFTIEDETDGTIAVTTDMITETVDTTIDGMYTVSITVTNTSGNSTTTTIMIFVKDPLNSYSDVSESTESMLTGAVVRIDIFDDVTFKIYVNDVLKGTGTYVISDTTIQFTYTDPSVDNTGTTLPTITGTISTTGELTALTVITTTVTSVYLPMGSSGMVVDYEAMVFEVPTT